MASVEPDLTVTCSRAVKLVADAPISECAAQEWDLIALPVRRPAGRAAWCVACQVRPGTGVLETGCSSRHRDVLWAGCRGAPL